MKLKIRVVWEVTPFLLVNTHLSNIRNALILRVKEVLEQDIKTTRSFES
jgi:hypothetical protein